MDATRYDVVVVGGGHNGLVAAAYLGKAGRSVLMLERLAYVGGAAVSEAVFPGVDVRLSKYSYLVSLLPDQIVSDLGLTVALADRTIASYTPLLRSGRDLGLLVERPAGDRTRQSFLDLTGAHSDFEAWQDFYARIETLAQDLAPTLLEPLATVKAIESRLRDPQILTDLRELPLAEFVGRALSDDHVRGVALTDGLIGTFADLHATDGLAARCFLYHLIGNGSGQWRVPIGGMGAVSASMAEAARRFGADITVGATVTDVAVDGNGAEVTWTDQSGSEHTVSAAAVVSGVAPQVMDALRGRTPSARPVGAQLKLNMVLNRLPRLRSGLDPSLAFSGTLHVNQSASQLDTAYAAAAAGRLPDPLPFEVYCHSLSDPTILGPGERAAGYQSLTLFGLHTPTALFDGNNEGVRARAAQLAIDGLNGILAEPLEDCLARDSAGALCIHAASPLDVEAALAMPGGNIFHGDLSWPWAAHDTQSGTWGVETDEPRLVYAASGGAVRGGAVSGIGGHNAAHALLDRG
ncbi:MAG: NAD(P)/FAD-dependent oxidoreductase [Actinomycetota bacterium]|nr:NAD(P)/FAD-dependent oxidoreductase [Actinomycetota bacterium]